jgi:O-antigen ligase
MASIICLFIALQDFTFGNLYYTHFSYFLHPSYFALYVVFSIHIVWQLISTEKGMGIMLKWLLFIVMLYFSFIVYLISSKIGIISGILSLSLIFLHEFSATFKFSKRTVFLAVLISLFVYSGATNHRFRIFSENIQKTPTENTHTRFLIWQESLNVIEENIFFGQGTGDAQSALNKRYLSKAYMDAYEHQLNAHNQYLETFISLGLIGFIALLLLFILPLYYLKDHFEILPGVFLFLVGFHLLFESMFERFWGIVFFAFFYAMFFISNKPKYYQS